MFYREAHRRLFRAMAALVRTARVIDHVTLREELERRGELDVIGGIDYLAELVDAVPTAANLEFHAAHRPREGASCGGSSTPPRPSSRRPTPANRAPTNSSTAEARSLHISQERREEGFIRIKEMLWPTMERIETLHRERPKRLPGCRAGS
jgi:replicative DNA helicase